MLRIQNKLSVASAMEVQATTTGISLNFLKVGELKKIKSFQAMESLRIKKFMEPKLKYLIKKIMIQ